jgi:hypothetical protein
LLVVGELRENGPIAWLARGGLFVLLSGGFAPPA